MTAEKMWAALHAKGITKLRQTSEDYVLLEGPDGLRAGMPAPEALLEEEREGELKRFFATHMLED